MKYTDYFAYVVNEIHSVIAATTDENGLPITCAIDMMDFDENGLYFLTAKGKNFYQRLKTNQYIAFTGMKGEDTMSRIALSVRGNVVEVGAGRLSELFEKNPYMYEIYSTEQSLQALYVSAHKNAARKCTEHITVVPKNDLDSEKIKENISVSCKYIDDTENRKISSCKIVILLTKQKKLNRAKRRLQNVVSVGYILD